MPRRKKKITQPKKSASALKKVSAAARLKELRERRFKWGESYTSLLMGIVVVVVGVLLGVSIFRGAHKPSQETSSIATTATSVAEQVTPTPSQKKYTVQVGDSLWTISEKFYKSGYNWTDIAKANNLDSPNSIFSGNVLVIPKVTPKQSTVVAGAQIISPNAITASSYTVRKGDSLWDIAVRAYGDGYRWTDIAKANNLANPDFIYSGNVLQIPR